MAVGAVLVPTVMRMFRTEPLKPSPGACCADPIQMDLLVGLRDPLVTWLDPFRTQLVPLYANTSSFPPLAVPAKVIRTGT